MVRNQGKLTGLGVVISKHKHISDLIIQAAVIGLSLTSDLYTEGKYHFIFHIDPNNLLRLWTH